MSALKLKIANQARKILAVAKVGPILPIEIVFLKKLNLAYWVVSKNGCSSVKEAFVASVLGEVDLPFEKVHDFYRNQGPLLRTKGLFHEHFTSRSKLRSYLRGKNLLVIQRPILSRFRSGFLDCSSGKNKMIFPTFPTYNAGKKFSISDIDKFVSLVCGTSDYLADPHYRTQSFYWDAIPGSSHKIQIDLSSLQTSFEKNEILSSLPKPKFRNLNPLAEKPAELSAEILEQLKFRYRADIDSGIAFT